MVVVGRTAEERVDQTLFTAVEKAVVIEFSREHRLRWHHGPLINRRLIGECAIRDFSHDLAVLPHTQKTIVGDAANGHDVEAPFMENVEYCLFLASFCDQEHAL